MRHHTLDITIDSDIDLTRASSRRVTVTREPNGSFRVRSDLRFYASERRSFVGRHLKRKLGPYSAIRGQCSTPSAYLWNYQQSKP